MFVVRDVVLLSCVPTLVQPVGVACAALSLELMTMSITSPLVVPPGTLTEVFAVALQVAAEDRYATAACADGTPTSCIAMSATRAIKPSSRTRRVFECVVLFMIVRKCCKGPCQRRGKDSNPRYGITRMAI